MPPLASDTNPEVPIMTHSIRSRRTRQPFRCPPPNRCSPGLALLLTPGQGNIAYPLPRFVRHTPVPVVDPETTCPFCDTERCDTACCETCGGCSGACNPYHSCACWDVRNERGEIVDRVPSGRC